MTLQKLIDADTRHVAVAATLVLFVLLVIMAVFLYIVRLSRGDSSGFSGLVPVPVATIEGQPGSPAIRATAAPPEGSRKGTVGPAAVAQVPTYPVQDIALFTYRNEDYGFHLDLMDSWRAAEVNSSDLGSAAPASTAASLTAAPLTATPRTAAGSSAAPRTAERPSAPPGAAPTLATLSERTTDQDIVFEDPQSGARLAISVWTDSPSAEWDSWAAAWLAGMQPIGGAWAPTALIAGEPAVVAWAPESPTMPAHYAVVFDHDGSRYRVAYSAADGGQLMQEFIRSVVTFDFERADPTIVMPPVQLPPLPQPTPRYFPREILFTP